MRLRSSANVAALPRTGAIVFTICVYPTPIRDLGSGEAGWLAAAKRGIKEEELVYRCGVSFGSFLVWCWVGCMLMCFLCTDGIDDAIRASGALWPIRSEWSELPVRWQIGRGPRSAFKR